MFDRGRLETIKKEKEKWDCGPVQKTCAKFPERKTTFTTISGEEVDRLYTPADVADFDYEAKLGFPGEYTHNVQGPLVDHAPVCWIRHRTGDQ